MRLFAIAAVAVLGLFVAKQANAADLGGGHSYGRSYASSSYDDGPYYVTPRGDTSYVECGRPRVPYPDDAYGPEPNSQFSGPVGYRCVHGRYAYEPFYPPRCVTAFFKTPHGWQRKRRCF